MIVGTVDEEEAAVGVTALSPFDVKVREETGLSWSDSVLSGASTISIGTRRLRGRAPSTGF